ncbi:MAG: hypothetical protein ACFFCC_01130 [Promethearchaeota archaeon]
MMENLLDQQVQMRLIRAIDFSSMELANKYPKYDLARIVYYKTKKDVVEFKRVNPINALTDKDVISFVLKHQDQIQSEFYGKLDDLRDYILFCYKWNEYLI